MNPGQQQMIFLGELWDSKKSGLKLHQPLSLCGYETRSMQRSLLD